MNGRFAATSGAYLVADEFELSPGETHEWFTVADMGLDHRALVKLQHALKAPDELRHALIESCTANTRGLRHRVAAANGLQHTADRAASVHHFSNVMFNAMRGGTLDSGYECPRKDFAKFLKSRSTVVFARHERWVAELPERISLTTLAGEASRRGDAQLRRLANEYLPLCFSRRHGDPSRRGIVSPLRPAMPAASRRSATAGTGATFSKIGRRSRRVIPRASARWSQSSGALSPLQ